MIFFPKPSASSYYPEYYQYGSNGQELDVPYGCITLAQAAGSVGHEADTYKSTVEAGCNLLLETPIELQLFQCDRPDVSFTITLAALIANFTNEIRRRLKFYLDPDDRCGIPWDSITIEGYGSCWRDLVTAQRPCAFKRYRDIDFRVDLSAISLEPWHNWVHITQLLRDSLTDALRHSCKEEHAISVMPWIFQGCTSTDAAQQASERYAFYRLKGAPQGSGCDLEIEFWLAFDEIRTFSSVNEDLFVTFGANDDAFHISSIGSKASEPTEAIILEKNKSLKLYEPDRLGRLGALRIVRSAAKGFDWPGNAPWQRAVVLSLIRQRPQEETLAGLKKMHAALNTRSDQIRFLLYCIALDSSLLKSCAANLTIDAPFKENNFTQNLLNWLLGNNACFLEARWGWIGPFLEAAAVCIDDTHTHLQYWGDINDCFEPMFSQGEIADEPPPEDVINRLCASPASLNSSNLHLQRRLKQLSKWLDDNPAHNNSTVLRCLPEAFGLQRVKTPDLEPTALPEIVPAVQMQLEALDPYAIDESQALEICLALRTEANRASPAIVKAITDSEAVIIAANTPLAEIMAWLVLGADLNEVATLHALYFLVNLWINKSQNSASELTHKIHSLLNAAATKRILRIPAGLIHLRDAEMLDGLRIAIRDCLWPEAPPIVGLIPPRQLLRAYADYHPQLKPVFHLLSVATQTCSASVSIAQQMLALRPLFRLALKMNPQPEASLLRFAFVGPRPCKRQWEQAVNQLGLMDDDVIAECFGDIFNSRADVCDYPSDLKEAFCTLCLSAYTSPRNQAIATALAILLSELTHACLCPERHFIRLIARLSIAPETQGTLKRILVLCDSTFTRFFKDHSSFMSYLLEHEVCKEYWEELDLITGTHQSPTNSISTKRDWICCEGPFAQLNTQSLMWRITQMPSLRFSPEEAQLIFEEAKKCPLTIECVSEIFDLCTDKARVAQNFLSYVSTHATLGSPAPAIHVIADALELMCESQNLESADQRRLLEYFYELLSNKAPVEWDNRWCDLAATILHKYAVQEHKIRQKVVQAMLQNTTARERITARLIEQNCAIYELFEEQSTRVALLLSAAASPSCGKDILKQLPPSLVSTVFNEILHLEFALAQGSLSRFTADDAAPLLAFFADCRRALSHTGALRLEALSAGLHKINRLTAANPEHPFAATIKSLNALVQEIFSQEPISTEQTHPAIEQLKALCIRIEEFVSSTSNLNSSPGPHEEIAQQLLSHLSDAMIHRLRDNSQALPRLRELLLSCGDLLGQTLPGWAGQMQIKHKSTTASLNAPEIQQRVFHFTPRSIPQAINAQEGAEESTVSMLMVVLSIVNSYSGSINDRTFMLKLITLAARHGAELRDIYEILHGHDDILLHANLKEVPESWDNYLSALDVAVHYGNQTHNPYLLAICYFGLTQLLCPAQNDLQWHLYPLLLAIQQHKHIYRGIPSEFKLLIAGHFTCFKSPPSTHLNETTLHEIAEDALKSVGAAPEADCANSPTGWRAIIKAEFRISSTTDLATQINLIKVLLNSLQPHNNNLSARDFLNILRCILDQTLHLVADQDSSKYCTHDPTHLLAELYAGTLASPTEWDTSALTDVMHQIASMILYRLNQQGSSAFTGLDETELSLISVIITEQFLSDPYRLSNWKNIALLSCSKCFLNKADGLRYIFDTYYALLSRHQEVALRRHFITIDLPERLDIFMRFEHMFHGHHILPELIQLLEIIVDLPTYASLGDIRNVFRRLPSAGQLSLKSILVSARGLLQEKAHLNGSKGLPIEMFVFCVSCGTVLCQLEALNQPFDMWTQVIECARVYQGNLDARTGRLLLLAIHPLSYVILDSFRAKPKQMLAVFVKLGEATHRLLPRNTTLYFWIQRAFIELSYNMVTICPNPELYKSKPQVFEYFLESCSVALLDSIEPEVIERDLPCGLWASQQLISMLKLILRDIKLLPSDSQLLKSVTRKIQLCIDIHQLDFYRLDFLEPDDKRSLVHLICGDDANSLYTFLPAITRICWSSTDQLRLANQLRKASQSALNNSLPTNKKACMRMAQQLLSSSEPLAGCTLMHIMLSNDDFIPDSRDDLEGLCERVVEEIAQLEGLQGQPVFLRCLPLMILKDKYQDLLAQLKAWTQLSLSPFHLNCYGAASHYSGASTVQSNAWMRLRVAFTKTVFEGECDLTIWLRQCVEALEGNAAEDIQALLHMLPTEPRSCWARMTLKPSSSAAT